MMNFTSKTMRTIHILLVLLSATASATEMTGELRQWHTVTLTVDGPTSSEDATPNPFTDYRMTVWFIHPETTRRYEVPGFFAVDGNAAETSATGGNRWRARFSPPMTGRWTYKAELRQGGEVVPLENPIGEFTIAESDKTGDDFRHHGHLRYVGERYLQFAGSKRYFLKAGTDSPETLLGYHDFDGTWRDLKKHPVPAPHNPIDLPSLDEGLHRYPDHVKDWRASDPTWQDDKGKGLIGGLNYLSNVGVNSVYFLTMNVNGDGRNVWPWTGPWNHDRFDVSKLAQWEIVFEHMQRLGIQMHVVLQETENDHMLDGGELGPTRELYLREMVARFAHHPAIVWNLGEENLQTPEQQQAMADYLRGLDPYDHPIVIHNDHYSPTNIQETFDPHLGKSTLDGTALQDFHWNDVHYHTKRYVDASHAAGKPWVVCADEMGGAQFGLRPDAEDPEHFDPRSKGLWGNLMGGGAGVEWYFGWQNNSPQSDLSAETWRPREGMFRQTKHAVDFFQKYLPFEQMRAADHLALAYADYCFAKPGEVYCIYLFSGGNTRLKLAEHRGPFSVHWFDPKNGGELQTGTVETVWGPGQVDVGEPPSRSMAAPAVDHSAHSSNSQATKDWVCLVRKTEPVFGEADARIVVEAEHFESQSLEEERRWYEHKKSGSLPDLEGSGNATTWTRGILSAATTASNKRLLRLLPDTRRTHDDKLIPGENFSNEPGKLAVLSYRVHFKQAGRYYVWVRAFSTGTEDNGLHVGLDGQWPQHGQRMQWCEGKNQWTWGCAQRTEEEHCGIPMEIYLDVNEPGIHTVRFSMREDGFAFDQFLLTRDREYRPKGVHETNVAFRSAKAAIADATFADRKATLDDAVAYLRSHCNSDGARELIIIKDGKTLYEGNNTSRVHNIWSCSKSFTSTALGLLIAEGKCSLDTLACEIDPELKPLYPHATLRHFTTMTSGFSGEGRSRWNDENSDWSWTPYVPDTPHFAPGSAYAYWDEAQMTMGRLLTRVAKQNLRDYLDERVFQPIGMGDVKWGHEGEIDGIPICNGCTNVELSAKQLAKFGQLFLNQGKHNGKQIIPAKWIEQATKNQVPVDLPVGDTDRANVRGPGAYGFNWWVNGGENHMPDVPPNTFYASGLHHNLLFVIPKWNMVIVRMGTDGNPPFGKHNVWNHFLKRVGQATKSE